MNTVRLAEIAGNDVRVSASIGISSYIPTGDTSLLAQANRALYRSRLTQSFVDPVAHHPANASPLRAIFNFARDSGIGIVAADVRTHEQRSPLAKLLKARSIVPQGPDSGPVRDYPHRFTEDKG